MRITIFGAAGPTGLWTCNEALRAGHSVTAISRRSDPLPLPANDRLTVARADAHSGEGVAEAVTGADAVISTLGAPYGRRPISIYSSGTRTIVEAVRSHAVGERLVVVSSGLTYPPPPMNWAADHLLFPFLRDVLGRTLYADMRRMEEYLRSIDDIAWTIMRPGRLIDADHVSDYVVDFDHPKHGFTTRPNLAAAMVAEAEDSAHARKAVAPTTTKEGRRR